MINIWLIHSLLAFLATLSVNLLIRKIHLRNIPLRIQNSVQFIMPFLGFSVWGLFQPQMLKVDMGHLALILIFAVVFTQLGTILANKAITLSKNPGYPVAVTRTNVLITTLISVLIFNSYLNWITFSAVLVITFSSFLFVDYSKKEIHKSNNLWLWYALVSGVLTSGYALGSKFFINQNIPLLTRMFYAFFMMSFVQVGDLIVSKTKIQFKRFDLILFLGLGVSIFLFNIFAQLAFENAPNPGFVNAFLAASIIPTTFLAAYFFKDELNKRKVLGALGVLAGLSLLYLYS